MSLENLLRTGEVWRGGELPLGTGKGIPTGYAALDAVLAGGGWPQGALTEILTPHEGSGALSLVMPALARLSQDRRWLAWVAPPHVPYAPALASAGVDLTRILLVHPRGTHDALWAVEQALRSGTCSVVLAWLEGADGKAMRRLQLAAEAGQCCGVLFRSRWAAQQPSPVALRLALESAAHGVQVQVLKHRGSWAVGSVQVDLPMGVPGTAEWH